MPHDAQAPSPAAVDALFARAQAGEADAARELLAALQPEVQLFVRLNLGGLEGRESVADVTQSVVTGLLPQIGRERFADLPGMRAWLRAAARNKIVDLLRRHGAQKRGAGQRASVSPSIAEGLGLLDCMRSLATPSQAAMRDEDRALLDRALQRLPEDQRKVVAMARLLEMPHKEIAAALGRSESACRMLLQRGMVNLARELEAADRDSAD